MMQEAQEHMDAGRYAEAGAPALASAGSENPTSQEPVS